MYYEYTYILAYVRTTAGTKVRSLKSLFASSACLKIVMGHSVIPMIAFHGIIYMYVYIYIYIYIYIYMYLFAYLTYVLYTLLRKLCYSWT